MDKKEAVISRTTLITLIRRLDKYEDWKRAVFIRDRFTCQHCRARNGRKRVIEADHVRSLAQLVSVYRVFTLQQAIGCPVLWDVSNGRTLCHSCHEQTDSYPKNFCRKKKRAKRKKKK